MLMQMYSFLIPSYALLLPYRSSSEYLFSDLANTNTSQNSERQLVKISKLVLVRSLGEIANLRDVNSGVSKVIFCDFLLAHSLLCPTCPQVSSKLTLAQVHVPINLKVSFRSRIRRVLRDDKAISRSSSPRLAEESVGFDEHLVVGAALDGLVAVVDVEIVVNVLVAKAAGGTTGATVALPERDMLER
jgi:hypothetical protein